MIVALDTNILVYAEGMNDAKRQQMAEELIERVGGDRLVVPVQALAELFNVLVRKYGRSAVAAGNTVRAWSAFAKSAPTTGPELSAALDLAVRHGLQIFDSVILAASALASADMLLSEDMQEGFAWRGVTVVNPFAASPHPLLTALLS